MLDIFHNLGHTYSWYRIFEDSGIWMVRGFVEQVAHYVASFLIVHGPKPPQ